MVAVPRIARVKKFQEKPSVSNNKTVLASMGNYIFDADFFVDILNQLVKKLRVNDFGKHIIPHLIKKKERVFAYDFSGNRIPYLRKYEARYYWRDVGSVCSYWQANMDLLGKTPVLDLDNRHWPIYASNLNCPGAYTIGAKIENSIICEGAKIFGSSIKNSIIGRSVVVEEGCEIEDSIIMDFTQIKKHSRIRKAIIDRFNIIAQNKTIGYSPDKDRKKYHLDPSGIVVVGRGSRGTEFLNL